MKKTIVFCLFCVIFTLIFAPAGFAQDDYGWEDSFYEDDYPDPYSYDSSADTEDYDAPDAFGAGAAVLHDEPAAPVVPAVVVPAAAPVADPSAASANVQPQPPPQPQPQPPVRIVIPLTASPASPVAAPPVNNLPPIKIIPAMPNPHGNSMHRVQVGAFSKSDLAQQCFSRLASAGFSPAYEPSPAGNMTRVVLPGIRAADVPLIVQRLAAAGFSEVWIREER